MLYYSAMSYLVLARKYRPMTFKDVVAQEHVTKTIQNSVQNDRLGSSYLFCGPRGTGKTTTARILAKMINCAEGPTPTPCGECAACIEITNGSSLDVLEIDAASNTGVDDIRTLRENVRYMPTSGKMRIYIIDEVHRLSGAAFDALLKTLEEPPAHVMFIFATTEPNKVPETILSRTQRFDFKRVTVEDLAKNLINIAQKDKVEVNDAAAKLLARKADGSVRDSLSLLDQIIAFAGTKIIEQDVIDGLGLVDRQFLFEFTEAIASKNSKNVLKHIRQLFESGVDIKDFVNELLEHLRVLMILATDKEVGPELNFAEEELKQYLVQADYFSIGDIIRFMTMGADLNRDLRGGMNERLLLEMTGVKMAEMESTILLQDVIARLDVVSQSGDSGADLFKTPEKKKSLINTPPETPSRERVTFVKRETPPDTESIPEKDYSGQVNIPILTQGWSNFIQSLKLKSPMLASQLSMAEIKEVKDSKILFVFSTSEQASKELVEKQDNIRVITDTLRDHFRANISIRFDIDNDKNSHSKEENEIETNNQSVAKLIEQSPRIKSLIEKVDGEIIGLKKIKK